MIKIIFIKTIKKKTETEIVVMHFQCKVEEGCIIVFSSTKTFFSWILLLQISYWLKSILQVVSFSILTNEMESLM